MNNIKRRHPSTIAFWVIMAASVLVFGGHLIRFAAG